eukprot:TRINITY_DN1190_c0_g1_i22.p1 TRINITY_DN1190_c0_g1~~TRINITY_DN1190_c0_g1_i22.p1  ORF type:complete len:171 (-),score=20.84 TRINITY_DN1190_c0_g1_i22:1259-1771(-)
MLTTNLSNYLLEHGFSPGEGIPPDVRIADFNPKICSMQVALLSFSSQSPKTNVPKCLLSINRELQEHQLTTIPENLFQGLSELRFLYLFFFNLHFVIFTLLFFVLQTQKIPIQQPTQQLARTFVSRIGQIKMVVINETQLIFLRSVCRFLNSLVFFALARFKLDILKIII